MKVFSIVVVFALITGAAASAGILGKVKDAAGAVKDSTASAGSKAKGFVGKNSEGGDLFPLSTAASCTSASPTAMLVKVDWLLGGVTKMSAAAIEIRNGQRTEAPRGGDIFPLTIGEKICPVQIRVRKNFVDMVAVTAIAHTLTGKGGQSVSGQLWAELVFRFPTEGLEPDQIRGVIGQVVEPVSPVIVSSAQPATPQASALQAAQSGEMTSLDIGDPVAKVEKAAGAPIGHIGGQTVYSYLGVKIFVQDGKVVRTQ